MTSVSILDLIYLYVLMIYRNIVKLLERDSVKTCSKTEHCVDAAFKLEIRLEFLCTERILGLLISL